MKRISKAAIMLAALILLTLAGCGNNTEDEKSFIKPEVTAAVSEDGNEWLGKGGCYKLETVSEGDYGRLKGNSEHPILSRTTDDIPVEQLYDIDGNKLFENDIIMDYAVVEDGIWCVCEKGFVNGEYSQDCFVINLGFDGKEQNRFDVACIGDSIAVSSDNVVIHDDLNKVMLVYSTAGKKLGKVNLSSDNSEESDARMCSAGDGSIWLLDDTPDGKKLYPVNLSKMSLDSPCALPEDTLSIWKGTTEHIFLQATVEGVSYFDPETNNLTNILYWNECSIPSGELEGFMPDGDGFLCLSVSGLSRISPAEVTEIHPKTQLTLGSTVYYSGIQDMAAKFNAQSNDYYINIVDYSDHDKISQEDAQTKLNLDVINGEGLDMVMLNDIDSLQNSSVYEDMYPLMDADTELNREDFYGLKAMERGGKLLLAPSSLMISTFYGLSDVVGERMGWTWDEYFKMEEKLPSGGVMAPFLKADFFLESSLELYAPHAIDWDKGTCDFKTPEFIDILKAAKKGYDPNCPVENNYFMNQVNSMMAEGKMILDGASFSDVDTFAQSESYSSGKKLSYIGWPTPDGSCGSVYYVSGISICAATDQKQGCWEFAKYVLKSTYAYKPCFEKEITEATTPEETKDGEKKSKLTKEQADRYRSLLENITVAASPEGKISSIVLEEAADMFEGNKSPEDTAKIIQSKVSMYVAERE